MIFWSFSHITKFGSPWGFLTLSTSRLAARSSSAACRPRDAGVQPVFRFQPKQRLAPFWLAREDQIPAANDIRLSA
jgi:hypothetical protein